MNFADMPHFSPKFFERLAELEKEQSLIEDNMAFNERHKTYDKIIKEKESGKIFTYDDLTIDLLTTLWADEFVSDNEIAYIFNTTQSSVTTLRKRYDITQTSLVIRQMMNLMNQVYKELGDACFVKEA